MRAESFLNQCSDLWVTLWVRRSPKGEFFVMMPRSDQDWTPHASYHLDGTVHMKSFSNISRPQHLRPYVPFLGEATHPRCGCEGYPDWPGRASSKEGES